MPIIKGKGTFMTLISGVYAEQFYTGGTNDVWVQSLSYGPQWSSETINAFGSNDPVLIEDTYGGIKASFDVIETASKLVLSVLTHQDPASAIGFDPALFNKSDIVANFKNTKWKAGDPVSEEYIGSVLLKGLKVVTADTSSAVDGVQTKKFDFEGTGVIEFSKPLAVEQFTTAGGGNEVFSLANTAEPYPADTYMQLVLGDGVELVKGTDYTETATSITYIPNSAGVKLTVVYAYSPV